MDSRSFLGLEPTHNPFRWKLPVSQKISTQEGFMFGGCGLAAAISALEATSGRRCVWATSQYLSYTKLDDVVDIDVTIAVEGRAITQARAVCHVADREILTLVGWDDIPRDELAVVLGTTRANARVRLHRARRRFADQLATHGVAITDLDDRAAAAAPLSTPRNPS